MRGAALALAAAGILGTVAAPAVGQLPPGRLVGTLSDEQGQPLAGLKLKFELEGDAGGTTKTLTVDKKGKFSLAFFPAGTYRVTLEDPGRVLKSMVYVLEEVSGIEVDRKEAQAPSGQALPAIDVEPGLRVNLTLVAGPQAAAAAPAAEPAAVAAHGKLAEAADLYAAGDMEGVLRAADEALAAEPELGGAFYLRGVALWKLGRVAEAEQELRKAVELVPEQQGIWQVFGTVLLDRAAELEKAGQSEAAAKLGNEAVAAFDQELSRNPGNAKALTNRAVALDKAGRKDELESALRALLEADPANERARARLATLLQESGRPNEALEVLAKSAGGSREAAIRTFNVAVGLYNEDKMDEALAAVRQAAQLDPTLPQVHRLLGRIHLSQGDQPSAIAELEKYLELAPDAPDAATERQLLDSLKKQAR